VNRSPKTVGKERGEGGGEEEEGGRRGEGGGLGGAGFLHLLPLVC